MDPSLKNLIPCGENLFPCKVPLKVWGKGDFVGCFFFFLCGFFVKKFLVLWEDKGVFRFFEKDSVLLVVRLEIFPLSFSL